MPAPSRAACPSAGRRGARFGRRGGGAATNPYTPAASAVILPYTAIWISTSGLTLADGDTTVDSWLAGWGGIRPTLTAPAATNRPAYTAGAVPLLTFDGTDNVVYGVITKGSAWATYETGFVGSRVAVGAAGDRIVHYTALSTSRFGLQDSSAAAMRFTVQSGANTIGTSDPDGVTAHYSGDAAADGTQNIRKAGAVEATSASTTTSRADGENTVIGAATDGTLAANIVVMAAHMGPLLTTDQRTYLRALLTYYTGVAS